MRSRVSEKRRGVKVLIQRQEIPSREDFSIKE